MIYNQKNIYFFLASIFYMMFDFLKIHPDFNISIYKIIQFLILFLIIIFLLQKKDIKFNLYNQTFLYIIGFFLVSLFSTLTSLQINHSLVELVRLFQFIILAFIIFLFLKSIWFNDYWIYFAFTMLLCGVIAGISIIADYLEITNFSKLYLNNISTNSIRQFGILGESNFAAGKLGIFFPFALFLFHHCHQRKVFKRVLILLGLFIIIFAVFLTGSRMGGVTIILSLLIYIFKERIRFKRFSNIFIVFTTIMIMVFFIAIMGNIIFNISEINYLTDRYVDLITFIKTKGQLITDRSLSERIECIHAGLEMFNDYPITGIGLGNYAYIVKDYSSFTFKYSHNTFISILVETGLIGFIIFLSTFIHIGKQIYHRYNYSSINIFKDFYFYFGVSFINLIIMLFFLHDFGNKYFWGMFIPLSMYFDYDKNFKRKDDSKKCRVKK